MIHRTLRLKKRLCLGLLFAVTLCVSLSWGQLSHFPFAAIAQSPTADQWMQQGVDRYQAGSLTEAIASWQKALSQYQQDGNFEQMGTTLENLARAYGAAGQTSEELQSWEQAGLAYRRAGNPVRLARVLAEQAQAHSRVGQFSRAITILCADPGSSVQDCRSDSALGIVRSLPQPDQIAEVAVLGSLGDAYRLRGDFDRAIFYLEQGLTVARTLQPPVYLISMLNSLGNAESSLGQLSDRRAQSARQIEEAADAATFGAAARASDRRAVTYLQESLMLAQTSGDRAGALRALISVLPPAYRSGTPALWQDFLQQAMSIAAGLPGSAEKVYALIDLAKFVQLPTDASTVSADRCLSPGGNPQAEALLQLAIDTAQAIDNLRSQSFALGELGHLYECQQNTDRALELTRQAQLAADQSLAARDSLYLWQWQLGRILKAQQQDEKAIAAYEQSLATLDALREDILTANQDIQFDFREAVEPIYRELVELRLTQENPAAVIRVTQATGKTDQGNISLALSTLDNLKLAELQNYFGNDCVLTALNPTNINFADNAVQTAIFNTVVLDDRVAVILSIPTQDASGQEQTLQKYEWVKDDGNLVAPDRLIRLINDYRKGLERFRDAIPDAPLGGYDPTLAAQIYDWIIRPFEPLLAENAIQTLVFVQDGIFRSVPMTSLYDGSGFLIQKYAIAITPSINLTNLERADRRRLRALAVGFTESATVGGTSFAPLRHVASELQAIQQLLPRSVELLDQAFTLQRFEQALATDSYPIIHIATHGKFSAEADGTFLVTGSSPTEPNQKLTLNVLDDVIRQMSGRSPLELLVLSACQTATGDDRAALGLAGIAAQAGAKRVLASLWSVNDEATTDLITQFYQGLTNSDLTKAQMLQEAQKALINSRGHAHPAFWSAFVLIGNWL